MPQRRLILAGALAAPLVSRSAAAQGEYPNRPLRLIYPYPSGGDVTARALAERLRVELGQPVIVENRPGGNSTLAARYVLKQQPADGYSILWAALPALTTGFQFFPDLGYTLDDVQPVSLVLRAPNALAVASSMPVRTLADFIEYARRAPNPVPYGVSGLGGSSQLVAELFQQAVGVRLEVVAYRGEPQAITDMLGGRIPAFCGSISAILPYYQEGAMRILGISSEARLPGLDQAPTFRNGGVDLVYLWWHGIALRAGTSRAIVDRLHAAVISALRHPSVIDTMAPGTEVAPTSPEEFWDVIRHDGPRLERLIRERGISM